MTPEQKQQLRAKIVEIALSQVGTREVGGNNNGAQIRQYMMATWLAPASWPWCAALCCWVLREALAFFPEIKLSRCQDASAFGWETWGRKNGCEIIAKTELAKAGDFVIFDFNGAQQGGGHIGIVVADQHMCFDHITTVEGNTNGAGDRESTTGDGVWEKRRTSPGAVVCYVRI